MCTELNYKFIKSYFENVSNNEKSKLIDQNLEIINSVRRITDLFIQYPFYHRRIIEETQHIEKLDKITEWQRCFYFDIYNEYHTSGYSGGVYKYNIIDEVSNLYKTLELKNSSFQFLIKLDRSLQSDVTSLEKDDLKMLRNLFLFTINEINNNTSILKMDIEYSNQLNSFEVDEIKRRAQTTFNEVKQREKK